MGEEVAQKDEKRSISRIRGTRSTIHEDDTDAECMAAIAAISGYCSLVHWLHRPTAIPV